MREDITCALSDDAIIAASNKECMLYFVEISLDGRLMSQVLFLQTPHIRIQRTVVMHVICFSVMDHSSLQTIVKPEYPEKNPRSRDENHVDPNKLNPHMTPRPGIEPGPHW